MGTGTVTPIRSPHSHLLRFLKRKRERPQEARCPSCEQTSFCQGSLSEKGKRTSTPTSLTIALAGQPNVGKSTIFNMLTGLNQHVGNWPGKTVERKEGVFLYGDSLIRLVDLPGSYSLTANSEEERIARDFLLRGEPDVVIVILNAATLERNLYLVAELLAMSLPMVIGINMVDVAEQEGIRVEAHVLQAALGIPVIPLVATHRHGLDRLIETVLSLHRNPSIAQPHRPELRPEHQTALDEIRTVLERQSLPYPTAWMALKLLEGDAEVTEIVRRTSPVAWEQIHPWLQRHEDAYLDIVSGRYEWIGRMVRAAVVKPKPGVISLTDRLDRILTHPVWGLTAFLGLWGMVFWLTFTVSGPIVSWLSGLVSMLAEGARHLLSTAPYWLRSLVADGIISGVGAVLTLLPVLLIFFATLGLLEDVGYLARSAYVMDRFMHWIGLHGRSFLPLSLAFGCNVPAIMGARIVEERRARLLTILLTPLVPCSGRMAVIVFLAGAFFPKNAALVSWGLVAGNLVILFLLGLLVHRGLFKGQRPAFIMEMPLYHLPNARTIGLYLWQHTYAFIRKAGSIIVLASMVIWALAYFPEGQVHTSLLAAAGRGLEPLGRWLGLGDWRLITALFSGILAKENAIAALGVLYGNESGATPAMHWVRDLTPASRLAFLVAQITFIPCLATLTTIRQESGSWKWVAVSIGMLLLISLSATALVYQMAYRLGG